MIHLHAHLEQEKAINHAHEQHIEQLNGRVEELAQKVSYYLHKERSIDTLQEQLRSKAKSYQEIMDGNEVKEKHFTNRLKELNTQLDNMQEERA